MKFYRHPLFVILVLFILALVTIDPPEVKSGMMFFIFQDRDLARAAELLKGNFIFFGPEMTGGGHLPGPLYYYLLAIPLALGQGWQGAFNLLVATTALGAATTAFFFFARASLTTALIWLVLLATGTPVVRLMTMFMNVSFVLPFMFLAIVLLWTAFGESDERRRSHALIALGAAVGLGIQLHLSAIVFAIAALVLQGGARNFDVPKLNLRAWMKALLAFFACLIPFLVWWISGKLGFAFGVPRPFVGSALYAPTSLLSMIGYAGFKEGDIFLWNAACQMLETIPWILIPLAISLLATKEAWPVRTLKPVLVCAAIGFIPFSYWFFVNIGLRYSGPFFVSVALIVTILHKRVLESERALQTYCWSAGALAVIIAFVFSLREHALLIREFPIGRLALLGSTMFLAAASSRIGLACLLTVFLSLVQLEVGRRGFIFNDTTPMPRASQWKRIWNEILPRTGWTFEEAVSRIYFVNHHIEQDPKPIFEVVDADLKKKGWTAPPFTEDGFIVSIQGPEASDRVSTSRWLLQQNIPPELKEAVLARDILLGRKQSKYLSVIPYTVSRPGLLPKHFQNYGRGYVAAPADAQLDLNPEAEGAKEIGENRYLFKWNDCPGQPRFCAAGILVQLASNKGGKTTATVTILGASLSQSSPWISPDWTQEWLEPFVEFDCGQNTIREVLIGSVGYSRDNASEPTRRNVRANNSILAPFQKEIEFNCRKKISEIRAGRSGSRVESIYRLEERPGAKLSLKVH